ncbi:MAG TPA: FtsH protease activity modulator HflK [Gammaproteobacteria bacterium]|nr:FtsH protease activity modulator HflK [Gammaproteobacteria bacterium]
MPWNQPGGDKKDPWGGGNKNNQGPPDLDEMLKKLTSKLSSLGGGKGTGGGGRAGSVGLIGILLLGFILWLASGFYIVGEGERGLVLRFGAYQSESTPGPHWHIPSPVETVELVDIDQVRSFQHRSSMLTQDENIVDIELAAQYRVNDAEKYKFNVRDPDQTLNQAVESALREAVGKSKMDFVLNEGRPQIAALSKQLTQAMLDAYGTGMEITTMNLQQSQPPEQVQDAFNDAIKAREDNVRFVNEAEAYANSVVPIARGEGARVTEEAKAYKEQVVSRAEGEADRFTRLLTEYRKAPDVTRERLYLETVETVLSRSSKVMMDTKGGNSMMYLPLDKLIDRSAGALAAPEIKPEINVPSAPTGTMIKRERSSRPLRRTTRESR